MKEDVCISCEKRVTMEKEQRDDDVGKGFRWVCPNCGEGNGTPLEDDHPINQALSF